MFDQEKTGKFIAESRKLKGLTQKDLAEQLGISDKTVSQNQPDDRSGCCSISYGG